MHDLQPAMVKQVVCAPPHPTQSDGNSEGLRDDPTGDRDVTMYGTVKLHPTSSLVSMHPPWIVAHPSSIPAAYTAAYMLFV